MPSNVRHKEKHPQSRCAAPYWAGACGRCWAVVAFTMLGAGLTAYAEESDPAGETVSVSKSTSSDTPSLPAIYVDRTIEFLEAGVNNLREGYKQRVAICQSAGLPTSPLSQDEVAQIGTKRWQYWRTSGQLAYRAESWLVAAGDPREGKHCEFTLALSGHHAYFGPDKTIRADLAAGEKTVEAPEPERLQIVDATPEARDFEPWRNWEGPIDRSVAGQPCAQWRSQRGETSCYWSGGTEWGFGYVPQGIFESTAGFPTQTIVLEAEPPPGGAGEHLTTSEFVIGATFSEEDMQP